MYRNLSTWFIRNVETLQNNKRELHGRLVKEISSKSSIRKYSFAGTLTKVVLILWPYNFWQVWILPLEYTSIDLKYFQNWSTNRDYANVLINMIFLRMILNPHWIPNIFVTIPLFHEHIRFEGNLYILFGQLVYSSKNYYSFVQNIWKTREMNM